MKLRVVVSTMLTVLILLGINTPQTEAASDIGIYVNGQKEWYGQPPVMDKGRVLVPLRGVFESLGASVNYNSKDQTIDAYKGNTTIGLKIGSKNTMVNGKKGTISVPAQIRNGRTLVPIRFISEALGEQVHWDEVTRTVFVGKVVDSVGGQHLIRGVKIGMTMQQVKQIETANLTGEDYDHLYYYNVTEYGITGTLVYIFENNRLSYIAMIYPEEYLELGEAKDLFDHLMYAIELDFGPATYVDDDLFDDPIDYQLSARWQGTQNVFLTVVFSEDTYLTSPGILFTVY